MTIELARPRIIAIDDRGRQYKFTVLPIAKKTWLAYFAGIVSTSEYQQNARVDSNDYSAARRELAIAAIADAEGYAVNRPLQEIEAWQSILPHRHLGAVGAALTSATRAADPPEETVTLGEEAVYLDAIWGADDQGVMHRVRGLRHYFRTPSDEHYRRFSREASRSRVIGGSRSAKTQWMGAQATLAELYDELIQSVDGYTVNGQQPASSSEIISAMDLYHKVAAADALFTPAPLNLDAEGER